MGLWDYTQALIRFQPTWRRRREWGSDKFNDWNVVTLHRRHLPIWLSISGACAVQELKNGQSWQANLVWIDICPEILVAKSVYGEMFMIKKLLWQGDKKGFMFHSLNIRCESWLPPILPGGRSIWTFSPYLSFPVTVQTRAQRDKGLSMICVLCSPKPFYFLYFWLDIDVLCSFRATTNLSYWQVRRVQHSAGRAPFNTLDYETFNACSRAPLASKYVTKTPRFTLFLYVSPPTFRFKGRLSLRTVSASMVITTSILKAKLRKRNRTICIARDSCKTHSPPPCFPPDYNRKRMRNVIFGNSSSVQ